MSRPTGFEFHAQAVALALQAFDRAMPGAPAAAREAFTREAKERLAQLATVYALECPDEMRDPRLHPDPTGERLDRARGRTCPTCNSAPGASCELRGPWVRDTGNSFGVHYERFG